jgi:hypothetical protein
VNIDRTNSQLQPLQYRFSAPFEPQTVDLTTGAVNSTSESAAGRSYEQCLELVIQQFRQSNLKGKS